MGRFASRGCGVTIQEKWIDPGDAAQLYVGRQGFKAKLMNNIEKAHLKNLNAIRKATKLIDRELNLAIRSKNDFKEQIYLRLLMLLWMTWAECKLNTLLSVPPQVSDDDRKYINDNAKSEIDRWLLLLDLFMRRRYLGGNQKKSLDRLTLGHTAYNRYSTILEMIERIRLYIEIRNRLAHGQWHIALNSNLNAENQEITQSIWKITKTDILILKRHLIVLGAIMNDLISSQSAFEGGFDLYLKQLDKAIRQFDGKMDEFRKTLLSKPYYKPIAWDKIQIENQ